MKPNHFLALACAVIFMTGTVTHTNAKVIQTYNEDIKIVKVNDQF